MTFIPSDTYTDSVQDQDEVKRDELRRDAAFKDEVDQKVIEISDYMDNEWEGDPSLPEAVRAWQDLSRYTSRESAAMSVFALLFGGVDDRTGNSYDPIIMSADVFVKVVQERMAVDYKVSLRRIYRKWFGESQSQGKTMHI